MYNMERLLRHFLHEESKVQYHNKSYINHTDFYSCTYSLNFGEMFTALLYRRTLHSDPIGVRLGHGICFDQGNVCESDMRLPRGRFKRFHHSFPSTMG